MTMPPTSLWWDLLPKPVQIRPSLTKDIDVDVAIIGAGYTGLWTAYYLLKKSPNIKVAILESNVAGCGAVGRAVAFKTRGPRFDSSHRQNFIEHLFIINCIEKTKINILDSF